MAGFIDGRINYGSDNHSLGSRREAHVGRDRDGVKAFELFLFGWIEHGMSYVMETDIIWILWGLGSDLIW